MLASGLLLEIGECLACGARHANAELYEPPIPASHPVLDGFSRENWFYLCPAFMLAVPYPLNKRTRAALYAARPRERRDG
ncbi:MAG: hypothetical protein ACRD19_11480 [Terriglobia bacterium]